ncbi:TPA: hypothetical protein N0F65_003528, partial [Lagenidium giganteum]
KSRWPSFSKRICPCHLSSLARRCRTAVVAPPPAAGCRRFQDQLSDPVRKPKGTYTPPASDGLAAHQMYRAMTEDPGKYPTPMDLVLAFQEMRCVRIPTPPAVLMALYSGRLGNRGASMIDVPESKPLEMGSTNKNFNMDFSPLVSLSRLDSGCSSYTQR